MPVSDKTSVRNLGKTMVQIERERMFADVKRQAKWDARFLRMAEMAGSWSKDRKVKVGAVLVVPGTNRVASLGYNGFPDTVPDDPDVLATREKHVYMIHAELNAILNCPIPTKGLTLYSTHSPCAACQPMVLQAGIARLVCYKPNTHWLLKHPFDDFMRKKLNTHYVDPDEIYDGDATYG